jgi:flagellar transcriptional activator FlhC
LGDNCPFCKLVQRYSCDPRLQASFPKHGMATAPATAP